MSDQSDILTRTLSRLGLEHDETRIYLYLLEKGASSALNISRQIHIARTRVYRLLDKLQAHGLVTQKPGALGLTFTASPYQQLDLLIAQRQSEIDSLKASMPAVFTQLAALRVRAMEGSKVLYHHGLDGLKHVTWNSLRARGEIRIYEVSASMTAFLPQEFSEKVRVELVEHKIHTKQLTNIFHIDAWTRVGIQVRDFWTPRYVNPKELEIRSEILLYNNVTAMYHYLDKDIFSVEIINDDLARMQMQLFDFIWRQAKPMKKIGEYGEAVVVRG